MCTHKHICSLTPAHAQILMRPCLAELLTVLWKKIRASKMCLEYVLTALTLTAYIESIHLDLDRPMTSVSCNWWDNVKTFKIRKCLQHDCTVWRLDWGKRDKSFHPVWLLWHVLCCPLLRVFDRLEGTQGLNPQKWIQPHKASWALWGCLSSCLCLHIGSIHVNNIRYLFRTPLGEGAHSEISWTD